MNGGEVSATTASWRRKNANRNHRSDMFHFGFAQVDHVFARRNYYSYSAQDVW